MLSFSSSNFLPYTTTTITPLYFTFSFSSVYAPLTSSHTPLPLSSPTFPRHSISSLTSNLLPHIDVCPSPLLYISLSALTAPLTSFIQPLTPLYLASFPPLLFLNPSTHSHPPQPPSTVLARPFYPHPSPNTPLRRRSRKQ